MNAATVAAVAIAAVTVMTLAGGVLALAYRTGRLVGRVESLIEAGTDRDARLDRDIANLSGKLTAHLTQHRQRGWFR